MEVILRDPLQSPLQEPGTRSGKQSVAALTLTQQVQAMAAALGLKGYFIYPYYASNCFLNSNGTGIVVSGVDPVGRANDLFNLGNHAIQATSGNRPTHNGSGVTFDGTNDQWTLPSLDLAGSTYAYQLFVGRKVTGNNNAPIMVHSTVVSSNNGTVGITANGGSLVAYQYNARGVTSQAQGRINHASDVRASVLARWNLNAAVDLDGQLDVWHNGAAQTVGAGTATPIGALTTQTHYIGGNGSAWFSGSMVLGLTIGSTVALTTDQVNLLIALGQEALALP